MAAVACASRATPAQRSEGTSLRIITSIEPTMGVVAVAADGLLLRAGEVAVYDRTWAARYDFMPGLYCLERQRARAWMPNRMVAERFAADDPVRFDTERVVIMAEPHPRDPSRWGIRDLRPASLSRICGDLEPDGPYDLIDVCDQLLGPIIGLYRPLPELAA